MIGPFRVERLVGTGSVGDVYEATQMSLGRTVALRLIAAGHFETPEQLARFDAQQRLAASLHHPNSATFYEVGEWEGGRFVATRFVRGASLADLREQGLTPPPDALGSIADALAAAHAKGLVHGAVGASNIRIEANGTAYLTDFGLGRQGSPEADVRALAEVASGLQAGAARRRRTPTFRLGLALAVAAAIAFAIVLITRDNAERPGSPLEAPEPPAGTVALGSALAPVATTPLGCREDPTPNTPACTFAQVRLEGRPLTIPRSGVLRSWAVRGASGELSLQVIRERGGRSFIVGFSQPQRVDGPAPQAFRADIGVEAGDRIGIGLGPGATVGARADLPNAAIARWDGRLTADPRPSTEVVAGVEVMVRADVAFGSRASGPRQLRGARAASASAGEPLTDSPVALAAGPRETRVVVVEHRRRIAIDVFGKRRLARLDVPDADPKGELLELARSCGPVVPGGFCLRWLNPGADLPVKHEYLLRRDGTLELIG